MEITLSERAEYVEGLLDKKMGFDFAKAKLYSIMADENEAFMLTLVQEHDDIYTLLDSRNTLRVAKVSDYIVVATCGWASPRNFEEPNDQDNLAPSEHPERRRVRLVIMVSKEGMASCLRFSDSPDEVITDSGRAVGGLATALYDLIMEAQT